MSNLLVHTPAEVLQQLLIDLAQASSVDDDVAWPVYSPTLPDTPSNAMVVADTLGTLDGRMQFDGEWDEGFGYQIRIRSKGPVDGYVKAQEVASAMDKGVNRNEVELGVYTYRVNSIHRTTTILRLGKELTTDRYNWTINGVASIELIESGTGS
jgi:hypothetical protein